MTVYLMARYTGPTRPDQYLQGQVRSLAVKTRRFSSKITIYTERGGHHDQVRGSQITYRNVAQFLSEWQDFKKLTKEGK